MKVFSHPPISKNVFLLFTGNLAACRGETAILLRKSDLLLLIYSMCLMHELLVSPLILYFYGHFDFFQVGKSARLL